MKTLRSFFKIAGVLSIFLLASCAKKLDEFNINPNGLDIAQGNPNLILPTVLSATGTHYLGQGYGRVSGVVQHLQEDGWHTGYNSYDWSEDDWGHWYDVLRNNQYMLERATALNYPLHQGISYVIKGFIFGTIADLWGDAPYSESIKGADAVEVLFPKFDSQEEIYRGVIADLKQGITILNNPGNISSYYAANYDIYYNGDAAKWKAFANNLLLRYAMRISNKIPDLAKTTIEEVYSGGEYIKLPANDAKMGFAGITPANAWPNNNSNDLDESGWRRRKPCTTLLDELTLLNDPRKEVWFQPVHCRWVVDNTLPVKMDEFIRRNGAIQNGVTALTDKQYRAEIAAGAVFTRHFNPALFGATEEKPIPDEYVGIPPGLENPDFVNYNPTPGQSVENQHASQMTTEFLKASGTLNVARLSSASEASFILAEAAVKGWSVGSAETHYNNGVRASLESWLIGGEYDDYINNAGVAFDGTVEQVLTQKWIAGFTSALEGWFDWRRTGFPTLAAPGPRSAQPVIPVRFIYGNNEKNVNTTNANAAIERNEAPTPYTAVRGKNSQWAKPWLLQGTGKPW